MWITAAGREPITCRPKTDVEGGVGSSSRWRREKKHYGGQWAAKRTWRRSTTHTKQTGGLEFGMHLISHIIN